MDAFQTMKPLTGWSVCLVHQRHRAFPVLVFYIFSLPVTTQLFILGMQINDFRFADAISIKILLFLQIEPPQHATGSEGQWTSGGFLCLLPLNFTSFPKWLYINMAYELL